MNEPFLAEKDVVSIVKYSLLSLVFGMALGAFGMVYFEKPKPQPVAVMAPTAVTVDQLANIERRMAALDAAKEANTVRAEQRVMEMRTALEKLERLQAKQDESLRVAIPKVVPTKAIQKVSDIPGRHYTGVDVGSSEIHQMAADLGVTRMVVK